MYSVDMRLATQEERHILYTQTDIHSIPLQRDEGGTYSGKVAG